MGGQICPDTVGVRECRRDLAAVLRHVERLKPAIAPSEHLALGERPGRPVFQVAHASRAALSFVKNALSSAPEAASLKPVNVPSPAISFAVRMNPPQAERASAPPTLMRRTPMPARSFTEW